MPRPAHCPHPLLALALVAALHALVGTSPAQAVKRRAFVTSVAGNGNLSAWPGATGATVLDKADSICRARAAAATQPLPNAATYRAWLSTSTVDAYCHVQGLSGKKSSGCNGAVLPGAGPWYLANGITNFTGSLDELVAQGVIFRPVLLDENLNFIPTAFDQRVYWTGTRVDGTADAMTCNDWTSIASGVGGRGGEAVATANRWGESVPRSCNEPQRLLCFEPGASDTSVLRWSPGALVFVSSAKGSGELAQWPESDGLPGLLGGDRICRNLAAAANLPSPTSFVSWLSTLSVDARDRVTTNGPFRRIDAYTVAGNFADLTDGTLDTSMHVLENGDYMLDWNGVWSGTLGDGTLGSANCANWTSESALEDGIAGLASYPRTADWTDNFTDGCASFNRIYCISNRITLFWDGFELTGDSSRWSSVTP
ncbi:MAG: hypothetical protein ABIV06_11290 [Thermoanaerobaculia bacterium]